MNIRNILYTEVVLITTTIEHRTEEPDIVAQSTGFDFVHCWIIIKGRSYIVGYYVCSVFLWMLSCGLIHNFHPVVVM